MGQLASEIAAMYLGIDFSGGAAAWRARCARPTVWIATIEERTTQKLTDLRPVQNLRGNEDPFGNLTALLRAGDFVAAAVDAPFAVPAEHLPPAGHHQLLKRVSALPHAPDRPFARGAALVELAAEFSPLSQKKPYRQTERTWIKRGVNTRSTLWNGPRGGAPFTVACLSLLARSERPIWPWNFGAGMLVEAFPAAQLRAWELPWSGYSRRDQQSIREQIVGRLGKRIEFSDLQRDLMLQSSDALDAVVAAFAAMSAKKQGALTDYPADGLIAVLDDKMSD